MPRTLLAPTAEVARRQRADVSIEAEYGSWVAEGLRYTAAHHQASGPYSGAEGAPSPCNDAKIPHLPEATILLSHLDLDSLGGALRVRLGPEDPLFQDHPSFWALAEFVDVRGPHRLNEAGATPEDQARLWAFWAWEDRFLRNHSGHHLQDVEPLLQQTAELLRLLLSDDPTLLQAGRLQEEMENRLNAQTFIRREGDVLLRYTHGPFCSHLYRDPDGELARGIVAWDRHSGGITVSVLDPPEGFTCRTLVASLWGPLAGGHAGIAGSPRGLFLREEEAERAFDLLKKHLASPNLVA